MIDSLTDEQRFALWLGVELGCRDGAVKIYDDAFSWGWRDKRTGRFRTEYVYVDQTGKLDTLLQMQRLAVVLHAQKQIELPDEIVTMMMRQAEDEQKSVLHRPTPW